MKKYLPYIFTFVVILTAVVGPFGVHTAHADFLGIGGTFAEVINKFIATVAFSVFWIVMRVVWIAGVLLNVAIYWTMHIRDLVNNVPMIQTGWTIFRDLANMFFIFMMIWIAITMILSGISGAVKNSIKNLILAALFLNFSFFFTGLFIDASNIVAKGFYDAVAPQTFDPTTPSTWDGGITGGIMSGFGIQTFYDQAGQATGNTPGSNQPSSKDDWFKAIIISVLGSVFAIVTAFVLFSAAIMAIIRLVVLILLLMLSPLAYIGMIVPYAKKYANEWWEKLFAECLWFPLYMVLLYIVIKAITTGGFTGTMPSGTFTDLVTKTTGGNPAVTIAFNFFLLLALMLGALIMAKRVGGATASMGISWAQDKYGKGVGALSRGAGSVTGWAGRNTFGKAGQRIAQSTSVQRLSKMADSKGMFNKVAGGLGKGIQRTGDNLAKGSYDIRDAKIPGGKTTAAAGVAAILGASGARVDFGSAKTDKEAKEKKTKEQKEQNDRIAREGVMAKGIKPALTDEQLQTMETAQIAAYTKEREKEVSEFRKFFGTMTDGQVVSLSKDNLKKFAEYLTPRQLAAIDKSDKFSDDDKKAIKEKYFERTTKAIESIQDNERYEKDFAGLSTTDQNAKLATLPEDIADRMRTLIGENAYEEYEKMNPVRPELTATQRSSMGAAAAATYDASRDAEVKNRKDFFDSLIREDQANVLTGQRLKALDARSRADKLKDHKVYIKDLNSQELNSIDSETYNTETTDAKKQAKAQTFVETLSDGQFDTFTESDRHSETERQALRGARVRKAVEALTVGGPGYNPDKAREEIARMSAKDISRININLLTANPNPTILSGFSLKKLGALAKDNTMDPADRDKLRTAITKALSTATDPTVRAKLQELHTWYDSGKGADIF